MADQSASKVLVQSSKLLPQIIISLLVIIAFIAIYNFWILYTYSQTNHHIPECEAQTQNTQTQNIKANSPIVRQIPSKPSEQLAKPVEQLAKPAEQLAKPAEKMATSSIQYKLPLEPAEPLADLRQNQLDFEKYDNMPKNGMRDIPEKGKVKFIVYHMHKGQCGHCDQVMNGVYIKLKNMYKSNSKVQILDFETGIDEEANKYHAFPVLRLVTPNKQTELHSRELADIVNAINNSIIN
jgi:hypothetical protein